MWFWLHMNNWIETDITSDIFELFVSFSLLRLYLWKTENVKPHKTDKLYKKNEPFKHHNAHMITPNISFSLFPPLMFIINANIGGHIILILITLFSIQNEKRKTVTLARYFSYFHLWWSQNNIITFIQTKKMLSLGATHKWYSTSWSHIIWSGIWIFFSFTTNRPHTIFSHLDYI